VTGRTLRTLAFVLAGVPVGALAFGVLVAGWVAVSVLAITPLVVPALVAFRAAVGGVARLDGEIANGLLETSVRPALRSAGPGGFWHAGLNVLRDGAFWRQQTYLFIRHSLGFAVAVAESSLLAASLGSLTLPIWYRWSAPDLAGRHVDTLGRALLGVPVGIVGLVFALLLLRPLAAGSRLLVAALLGGGEGGGPEPSPEERKQSLTVHATTYAVVNLALTLIWALTSRGYFWPEWTLIALGLPLAVHALSDLAAERVTPARRSLAVHGGAAASAAGFFTLVWAVSSRG